MQTVKDILAVSPMKLVYTKLLIYMMANCDKINVV